MVASTVKEIRRRDLIKGLGIVSACALTAQIGCRSGSDSTQDSSSSGATKNRAADIQDSVPRLNVILHGMFAVILNSTDQKVRILAPDIPDHVYFASTADINGGVNPADVVWKVVRRLGPKSSLQVAFTPPTTSLYTPPASAPTDRVLINSKASGIKGPGAAAYCTINLPWPNDIWPMRADTHGRLKGPTTTANGLSGLVQIPTVYVLTYSLNASDTPVVYSNSNPLFSIPTGSDGVSR